MNIDIRTVTVLSIVSSFFMSISLFAVSKGFLGETGGVRKWAAAMLVQLFSWIFIGALRGYIPEIISVLTGNTLVILSLSMTFSVLAEFEKKNIRKIWMNLLIILQGAVLAFFTLAVPDISVRIFFSSVCMAVPVSASAYILLKSRSERSPSRTFTGYLYVLFSAISLARGFYFLFWNTDPSQSYFRQNLIQDISYISFNVMSIMATFGFILMCADRYIDGRKKAENSLKESETLFKIIFDGAGVGLTIVDQNGKWISVNEYFLNLLGYTREELELLSIQKITHPDDLDLTELRTKEIMENRINYFRIEKRYICKNGNVLWVDLSVSARKNEQGKILSLIGAISDISSRKKTEYTLHKVLSEQEIILNNINIGIAKTVNRKQAWINNKLAEMFGYKREEMEGHLTRTLYPSQEVYESVDRKAYPFLSQGNAYIGEQDMIRKDGTVINVRINGNAVEPSDMSKGIIWIIEDITDQKMAREELLASEEKFKSFFEKNKAAFLIINPADGKINDANSSAANYYGYSIEKLKTMNISDINILTPPEIKKEMDTAVKMHRNYFNFRHKLSSGTIRDVEVYSTPIKIAGSDFLFSLVHDVTERKMAVNALRESETRLTLAIEGAKEGTWDWHIQTGKSVFSRYWAEMLGYSLEEIEQDVQSWRRLLHPEDRPRVMEILERHLAGDTEYYEAEQRMLTKSGKWKWILAHGKVIEFDEKGQPIRAIGTHVDIDVYKTAHEELKLLSEKLETMNAAKDKFFSIVAHDLKGPLGNLNALLTYLSGSDDLSKEELFENLRMLEDSSKTVYRFLENLLMWARSQNGSIIYNPEFYNLAEIIKTNITLLSGIADSKKITLKNKLENSLTAAFDRNMIDTVLRNLMSNSLKYTNEGGSVTVSAEEKDGKIEVSIQDSGIGMDRQTSDNLFRIDVKHFSKDGTKGEKGTGLGLILCKEFIDRHGGKIWAESEPGTGSTFRFTLPKNPI